MTVIVARLKATMVVPVAMPGPDKKFPATTVAVAVPEARTMVKELVEKVATAVESVGAEVAETEPPPVIKNVKAVEEVMAATLYVLDWAKHEPVTVAPTAIPVTDVTAAVLVVIADIRIGTLVTPRGAMVMMQVGVMTRSGVPGGPAVVARLRVKLLFTGFVETIVEPVAMPVPDT